MPELAEVEFYRKRWRPGLGQPITALQSNEHSACRRKARGLADVEALLGQKLQKSWRHGKQMMFLTSGGYYLAIHLAMTGKLRWQAGGSEPEKHDHLVLQTAAGAMVFQDSRQFGRVELFAEEPEFWKKRPPEVTSKRFRLGYVRGFLQRRGGSQIKTLLLDQSVFVGIGNWMADEILWRSRIAPQRRVRSLTDAEKALLHEQIVEVAQDALKVIGKDWSRPPDDWLFNHRWKDGGVCPQSGERLVREKIAGRTACWSPTWQC